jgi:DNA primase
MARIAEAELERLKASASVADLVASDGVVLMRQGGDLAGLCPFHAEDTPSLKVTPGKNLWHCFGCGAGGGAIDWVMKRRGVSFRHAVELSVQR